MPARPREGGPFMKLPRLSFIVPLAVPALTVLALAAGSVAAPA